MASAKTSKTASARSSEAANRRYVELRFSDSHITPHACRVCREPVTGVFVAAVRRGGRGEWLWDAHHVGCAARCEPQLARELFERPKPASLAHAVDALREHVGGVVLDPTATCFTRRPLHDVGRLFSLARGGACALCGRAIDGVALVGPRVDMGRPTGVPFHVACALETGEVSQDEILDRLRTVDDAQRELADEVRRALGVEVRAARAVILGADRKSAKREQLAWELWFGRPPPRATVEALVPGEWAWEVPTIARVRPRPDATTLAFRDALLAQIDALAAEGLYGASFCDAGDRPLERAQALEAAGRPPYPFLFVGRGQVPRGEWRVRVRLLGESPRRIADRTFDRWFVSSDLRAATGPMPALDALRVDGGTLSFRARYGTIPPDAPYLGALREGLDQVLFALHAQTPIALALLGDGDGAGEGDAWHRDSLARVDPALLAELRGAREPRVGLRAAEVERVRRVAREAHRHAEEMGDPKAAWEALEEILASIPVEEGALRSEVRALLDAVITTDVGARQGR